MGHSRGSSVKTKAKILEAARALFAERGFADVSIREIAAAAEIDHALVHRYFGSREDLITLVVQNEVAAMVARAGGAAPSNDRPFEALPQLFRLYLTEGATTTRLLLRAEMDGIAPESMLPSDATRVLRMLTDGVAHLQRQSGAPNLPDPALVAVVIGAAMHTIPHLGPWLMSAVGRPGERLEDHMDEIVEILVRIVIMASGMPAPAQAPKAPATPAS